MVHIDEHTYPSSGRKFYVVRCSTCDSLLNSGHHYSERDLPHAKALAFAHVGNCVTRP